MIVVLPITNTTEATFEADVLKSIKPVLVSFCSQWSSPCDALETILNEITAEVAGRAKIITVDTEQCPNLAMWYGIQFLPTVLLFVNGRIRARMVTPLTKEAALSKLQEFMVQLPDATSN